MKIIQALWFNHTKNEINYSADWLDVRYHLMSWALSILSLKKYSNPVELLTDSIGCDLLIDKLVLPYSNVNLVFDSFENSSANKFWALKKIYSYSIHNEPFVFVDGDVFNFNPGLVKKKELVSQNFGNNFMFYQPVQLAIKKECTINDYIDNIQLDAVNTGVVGGTNFDFFKNFKDEVFDFVEKNKKSLLKVIDEYHIETKYINV